MLAERQVYEITFKMLERSCLGKRTMPGRLLQKYGKLIDSNTILSLCVKAYRNLASYNRLYVCDRKAALPICVTVL